MTYYELLEMAENALSEVVISSYESKMGYQ